MDISQMSVWEFACIRQGHIDSNKSEDEAPPMSDSQAAALGIDGF